MAGHVFISYVREDSGRVVEIQQVLQAAGIQTWRDQDDLWVGDDWEPGLRRAITSGFLFLACFSSHGRARPDNYQNRELAIAAEEARRRGPAEKWLIPVRLDACEVPHHDLGGGRTIESLHITDLFGPGGERETIRLVRDVGELVARRARPVDVDEVFPVQPSSFEDRDWARLLEQLRHGDCIPVIGAGASYPTLPPGAEMSRELAERYDYPFEDVTNLPQVVDFAGAVEGDTLMVKQRLAAQVQAYGEPDFADPGEPHALLARLPLPVYATTNYDDFMTRALERYGKQPVTAVYPWYRDADRDAPASTPRGYRPTVEAPLVYHLYGSARHPPSMVATEGEQLEHFRMLAAGDGFELPLDVMAAFTRRLWVGRRSGIGDAHGVTRGRPVI